MVTHSAHVSDQRLSGIIRVVVAGLVWGTIPLIIRVADGASVVKVFFRVIAASTVIVTYLLASGNWREFRTLPFAKWRQLVVQGLVLTLNWILFLTALDMTTVATAELLGYTAPVLIAALGPFVTGERFDVRILAPLALALGGIAVILLPQGLAIESSRELTGAALAFGSALTYATLMLRSKKILAGVSSAVLMTVEYTVAALVLSPFVVRAYLLGNGPTGTTSYVALVTLGVVHTAATGFLFLGGLRRVRTDQVAILTYIEPVSAVLFASLFLAEPLTAATGLGGAMVVAGGIIVARLKPSTTTLPLEVADSEMSAATPIHDSGITTSTPNEKGR